jgi:hypothetical protein
MLGREGAVSLKRLPYTVTALDLNFARLELQEVGNDEMVIGF